MLAEEILGLLMAAFALLGCFLSFATAAELCLRISYWLIWPSLIGLGAMLVSFIIEYS
jgi:hypothetical protein